MNPLGLILVAVGAFSMAGAFFDWDWFMESRKARLFVAIFTRDGARVVYGLLGLAFAVFGLLITAGVIEMSH